MEPGRLHRLHRLDRLHPRQFLAGGFLTGSRLPCRSQRCDFQAFSFCPRRFSSCDVQTVGLRKLSLLARSGLECLRLLESFLALTFNPCCLLAHRLLTGCLLPFIQ